jgi:dephospho-CoA kinase
VGQQAEATAGKGAPPRPYLIGLTGNIACGKSTVLRLLGGYGAETIDADREVHALYEAGSPVTAAIAARFGAGVLAADGAIDRRALGRLVIGDPAAMAALEAIVHPAVRQRIEARIAGSQARVVVIDAIKLIEGGLADRCDSVWVVVCDPVVQLARLMARDGAGQADAERRIAAQGPQADKVARANVVIDNSGTPEATAAQVARAWQGMTRRA